MPSAITFPGDCPIPQNRCPAVSKYTILSHPQPTTDCRTVLRSVAPSFSFPEEHNVSRRITDTLLQAETIPAILPFFLQYHPVIKYHRFPAIASPFPTITFQRRLRTTGQATAPKVRFFYDCSKNISTVLHMPPSHRRHFPVKTTTSPQGHYRLQAKWKQLFSPLPQPYKKVTVTEEASHCNTR